MKRTFAIIVVTAGIALASVLSYAQGNYFGSGDQALSAFVRASYYSWQRGEIGLLVLWRGSERWYMQSPSTGRGSGNDEGYKGSHQYGSVRIDFVFERHRGLARVNGIDWPLSAGDNVLLIDGVDKADGRPSVRSLVADLTYTMRPGPGTLPAPLSRPDLTSIVRRSPEMVTFLQCDVPVKVFGPACQDLEAK